MAPRGRPPKRAVAPVEATAAQETPPEKRTRPVRTPKSPFEEAAAAENELGEDVYKVYYIKNVRFLKGVRQYYGTGTGTVRIFF